MEKEQLSGDVEQLSLDLQKSNESSSTDHLDEQNAADGYSYTYKDVCEGQTPHDTEMCLNQTTSSTITEHSERNTFTMITENYETNLSHLNTESNSSDHADDEHIVHDSFDLQTTLRDNVIPENRTEEYMDDKQNNINNANVNMKCNPSSRICDSQSGIIQENSSVGCENVSTPSESVIPQVFSSKFENIKKSESVCVRDTANGKKVDFKEKCDEMDSEEHLLSVHEESSNIHHEAILFENSELQQSEKHKTCEQNSENANKELGLFSKTETLQNVVDNKLHEHKLDECESSKNTDNSVCCHDSQSNDVPTCLSENNHSVKTCKALSANGRNDDSDNIPNNHGNTETESSDVLPSSMSSEQMEDTETKISTDQMKDRDNIHNSDQQTHSNNQTHDKDLTHLVDHVSSNDKELSNDKTKNSYQKITNDQNITSNESDMTCSQEINIHASEDQIEEALLSELESELDHQNSPTTDPQNQILQTAIVQEQQEVKTENQCGDDQSEINRLNKEIESLLRKLKAAVEESNNYKAQLENPSHVPEEAYIAQTKELEFTISKLQKELKTTKDKLISHDSAAKRAVATLQNELKARTEQSAKMYNECKKEKETMVIKYAQAEQKNIEIKERHDKMESKLREVLKEKDMIIAKYKALEADKQKADSSLEAQTSDIVAVQRELEKYKEIAKSMDVKMQWAQNKLKAELEAHKESKVKLDESLAKLKTSKKEAVQVYHECQSMIQAYHELKGEKAYPDQKMAKPENQSPQSAGDQENVHVRVLQLLTTLKNKHTDILEEVNTWRDKVKCLEQERLDQEKTLNKYRGTLQSQKKDNHEQQQKLEELDILQRDLTSEKEVSKTLLARVQELEQGNVDLIHDMEICRKQESEHLEFTEKISKNNALLQSEKKALEKQVEGLLDLQTKLSKQLEEQERGNKKMGMEFTATKASLEEGKEKLNQMLLDKAKTIEELTVQVEDGKDENRTLKRRQTASIKDLMRQLQHVKLKLEKYEGQSVEKDSMSLTSRTSSNGSLDSVGTNTPANATNSVSTSSAPSQDPSIQDDYSPIVEVVEIDKQKLLEKIVKLQKAHARKNEKVEFMEDHINQLLAELKKKSRIIQLYLTREETGLLTSETMDLNKAELQKKGGIMASVYGSHSTDKAMNLDFSLEINRKLQAVLEDTILKNITLKESLDTLGKEIARLSQENRRMQLAAQSAMN